MAIKNGFGSRGNGFSNTANFIEKGNGATMLYAVSYV